MGPGEGRDKEPRPKLLSDQRLPYGRRVRPTISWSERSL
jgi:hypothetical protein